MIIMTCLDDRIKQLTAETEELKRQNELYRCVIDNIGEGVYAVNENDVIVLYSSVVEQMEGYKRSDMLGKHEAVAYALDEQGTYFHDHYTKVVKRDKKPLFNCVYCHYRKDRKMMKLILDIVPFFYEGKYAGYYSIGNDVSHLRKLSANAMDRQQQLLAEARNENDSRSKLEEIIGQSSVMKDCIALTRRIALRDVPTMIIGETGTGKELIAQGIHEASVQRSGPFVPFNCAAIPDSLLESTLFGTTKGAFTGAVDTPGLFEQAEGGTIFLDEINSMPLQSQAKLLRVIQEKQVRRVGSQREIPVRCRIISATNIDPLAISSSFRSDLFFRLAVVNINLPPLRERGEDIMLLAKHFIEQSNQELLMNVQEIEPQLQNMFYSYHWPGNVRELQNIIISAMNLINANETVLRIEHIPEYFRERMALSKVMPKQRRTEAQITLGQAVHDFERTMILESLEANQWNISHSAKDLGILRENLYKKLKKYGLHRPNQTEE